MQKWVLEFVAGNGFIPGVTSPDQIADPSHPCNGAVPRRHAHFFRKNGEFGSLDWRGQPVDDGKYTVVDGRTFVISKEFPKVRFHYSIRGRDIRFTPVVSKGCLTFRCAWAISMAYPGKTWHRSAPAFASTGEAKLGAPAGRRPPPLDQWLPTGWKKFSTM